MIAIRKVRPEDQPALYRIWRDAVEATHAFVSADDLAAIDRIVRYHYLPNASLEVVEEDGILLAFMGLRDNEVESLFVDPAQHRRGIGRRLIDHAASGKPFLKVDVNEQNEGAVAFYRRLGFRTAGRSERDGSGFPYPLLHMIRQGDDQDA